MRSWGLQSPWLTKAPLHTYLDNLHLYTCISIISFYIESEKSAVDISSSLRLSIYLSIHPSILNLPLVCLYMYVYVCKAWEETVDTPNTSRWVSLQEKIERERERERERKKVPSSFSCSSWCRGLEMSILSPSGWMLLHRWGWCLISISRERPIFANLSSSLFLMESLSWYVHISPTHQWDRWYSSSLHRNM